MVNLLQGQLYIFAQNPVIDSPEGEMVGRSEVTLWLSGKLKPSAVLVNNNVNQSDLLVR
jgi:hypothetical protein